MYNFTFHLENLKPKMAGRPYYAFFAIGIEARFRYHSVVVGHCLICGTVLSVVQPRPPGRATRSMCETCYENEIVSRLNTTCFICGRRLPDIKITAQEINNRELTHNIHDGQCLEYYTIIHCKIGGEDMSFLDYTDLTFPSMAELNKNADRLRKACKFTIARLQALSRLLKTPNHVLALPSKTEEMPQSGAVKKVFPWVHKLNKDSKRRDKITIIRKPNGARKACKACWIPMQSGGNQGKIDNLKDLANKPLKSRVAPKWVTYIQKTQPAAGKNSDRRDLEVRQRNINSRFQRKMKRIEQKR